MIGRSLPGDEPDIGEGRPNTGSRDRNEPWRGLAPREAAGKRAEPEMKPSHERQRIPPSGAALRASVTW